MNACRLEGGKIVEEWEICDTLDVFRQLGLIQAPAPVSA
jgi:predicted ester cyclase